jgi:hypothetical protein
LVGTRVFNSSNQFWTRTQHSLSLPESERDRELDLLADLATALDEAGVQWFLFGAQAAILHGAARLTADVDVTVRLPASLSNEALVQSLEGHRFRRRILDPLFTERTRVIPLVHAQTELPLV